MEPILRAEAEKHGLSAEEDDGKLGVGVLEGEVDVAGGGRAVVGDFAFDPDVAILLLDEFADLADQLADRPDASVGAGLFKAQIKLRREWIGRGHSL